MTRTVTIGGSSVTLSPVSADDVLFALTEFGKARSTENFGHGIDAALSLIMVSLRPAHPQVTIDDLRRDVFWPQVIQLMSIVLEISSGQTAALRLRTLMGNA